MKISTRGEYGIRAMMYIAMHNHRGPVTSHEIATQQSIPEPYLRQILALLSRDDLVRSTRGPTGGHLLGRPAAEISLRDILLSLEGRTTSIDQILKLPCDIAIGTQHCAIREAYLEVHGVVDETLAGITLDGLAKRQEEILARGIVIPKQLSQPAPATAQREPGD